MYRNARPDIKEARNVIASIDFPVISETVVIRDLTPQISSRDPYIMVHLEAVPPE